LIYPTTSCFLQRFARWITKHPRYILQFGCHLFVQSQSATITKWRLQGMNGCHDLLHMWLCVSVTRAWAVLISIVIISRCNSHQRTVPLNQATYSESWTITHSSYEGLSLQPSSDWATHRGLSVSWLESGEVVWPPLPWPCTYHTPSERPCQALSWPLGHQLGVFPRSVWDLVSWCMLRACEWQSVVKCVGIKWVQYIQKRRICCASLLVLVIVCGASLWLWTLSIESCWRYWSHHLCISNRRSQSYCYTLLSVDWN
jgi:hypothetical protein